MDADIAGHTSHCPNSRRRFLLPKLRSTDFGHTSPHPVLTWLINHRQSFYHLLVILDLMLPGLGGLDVLLRLRTQSSIPVLILTARGQPEAPKEPSITPPPEASPAAKSFPSGLQPEAAFGEVSIAPPPITREVSAKDCSGKWWGNLTIQIVAALIAGLVLLYFGFRYFR